MKVTCQKNETRRRKQQDIFLQAKRHNTTGLGAFNLRLAIKTVSLLIALLCQLSYASGATLSSTVDKNRISQAETLTLMVAYDQQVNSAELDMSGLQNDFEIIGFRPQSSSSLSVINGKSTRVANTLWQITLVPKRLGTLVIPAFNVKGDISKPISIEVSKALSTANAVQALAVKIKADRKLVYPGQQLLVSIEIKAANDVSDLNGPPLLIDGADIEQIGQQSYQQVDNGIATQVVSLIYAVFPQQAGELVIPKMTYTGLKGGRRSIFDSRGQQVIARSQQITVQVEEPPGSDHIWFPAEDVTISAQWASEATPTAGEPITRTITITATGQRASTIPPLARPQAEGYKSYKDQPQLNNQETMTGIIGTRIESEAIVPSASGDMVLPELTLPWFDVGQQVWRHAVLPAETLAIAEAALSPTTAADQLMEMPPNNNAATTSEELDFWQILTVVLGLFCIAQFWFIVKLQKQTAVMPANKTEDASEAKMWKHLQKAIADNDAKAIRQALLAWARLAFPEKNVVSLQAFIKCVNDQGLKTELKNQLAHLDKHLYKEDQSYNAQDLSNVLHQLKRPRPRGTKKTNKPEYRLKPLYNDG